jgi:aconitate hydratase
VGIIQTARASGLEVFPVPYTLTNCHNSLCAVGGTINQDDHMFALSAAKKYGGIYIPPHQAVMHSYNREMMAKCGAMMLGSDSHTRYGAWEPWPWARAAASSQSSCWAALRHGPPQVGRVPHRQAPKGRGRHDVAIAMIGATYKNGYVKNKC